MSAHPPARLWPYLLGNVLIAIWIDFGHVHRMQCADSFLLPLSSLYEWRPFFWEQDRVGMLWPLLFSWCHHPLANLLLITGANVYLGLCLPVLMARAITPHPAAPAVATAMSAAVVGFGPRVVLENWLVVCNFPSGLALGLAALLLLDRSGGGGWRTAGRVAASWVLLATGMWLYAGILVFLWPFALLRAWLPGPTPTATWWRVAFRPFLTPRSWLFGGGCVFAVAAVFALMKHVQFNVSFVNATPNNTLPADQWADMSIKLATEHYLPDAWPLTALLAAVTTVGLALGLWRRAGEVKALAARVWPAVVVAVAEYAYLSSREWVVTHNEGHPRYLVAVSCAAVATALVVALAPLVGRWRPAGAVAFVLLLLATTAQFGWPGPDVPRRDVEELCGNHAAELTACRVDGVAGEYWRVWPAVFDYNLARYERAELPAVGITGRSSVWMHRWQEDAERVLRVGVIDDDSEASAARQLADADRHGKRYGLERVSRSPLQRVGRVSVYEYRVRAADAAQEGGR